MKFNTNLIIAAVVFVFVVLFSIGFSCTKVSPYYKDNLFPKYFKYEAFEPMKDEKRSFSSWVSGNAEVKPAEPVKVEGFQGLQSAPFEVQGVIDVFSQAQGSPSCPPIPYSNSMGFLCLDDKQKTLLTTRGGNATGKPMELGPQ
jgi:hypothetical protein